MITLSHAVERHPEWADSFKESPTDDARITVDVLLGKFLFLTEDSGWLVISVRKAGWGGAVQLRSWVCRKNLKIDKVRKIIFDVLRRKLQEAVEAYERGELAEEQVEYR